MQQQQHRHDDGGSAADLESGMLEMAGDLIAEPLGEFLLEAAGAVIEGAVSLIAGILEGI